MSDVLQGLLGGWRGMWATLRAARGALLVMLLGVALAGLVMTATAMIETRGRNAVVAQLTEGRDIPVDPLTVPDALRLARQYFLIAHDQIEDAQIFTDIAMLRADLHVRTQLLYNLANARVRQAFAYIENGDLDRAGSAIGLAKASYRQALHLEPQNWNLKHNLDVAQRLVRDLPRALEADNEELPPSKKAKPLWTDLPGLPRGLP